MFYYKTWYTHLQNKYNNQVDMYYSTCWDVDTATTVRYNALQAEDFRVTIKLSVCHCKYTFNEQSLVEGENIAELCASTLVNSTLIAL